MHVSGKKLALSGLLAAFSIVMIILAAVIESSSLFFLAAASFCIGIALREWGLHYGTAFYVATVFLGFLVAPNKMYVFTFAGMGLWLVCVELWFQILSKRSGMKGRRLWMWIGKYLIFNLIYIPALLMVPQLFIASKMNAKLFIILLAGGQIVLWIYDLAHNYFQNNIWGRFRGKFMRNL